MAIPETPKKETPKATVNINVPKGAKVSVRFAGIELGEEVTFVVNGKVTSVSQREYSKDLGVDIAQLRFIGKD